jgi:hypothetical protein
MREGFSSCKPLVALEAMAAQRTKEARGGALQVNSQRGEIIRAWWPARVGVRSCCLREPSLPGFGIHLRAARPTTPSGRHQ